MSIFPARDEREARKIRDAVEKCGVNRGPHDYIPIEWNMSATAKRVTKLLCRVCFAHVSTKSLLENYQDVSMPSSTST